MRAFLCRLLGHNWSAVSYIPSWDDDPLAMSTVPNPAARCTRCGVKA